MQTAHTFPPRSITFQRPTPSRVLAAELPAKPDTKSTDPRTGGSVWERRLKAVPLPAQTEPNAGTSNQRRAEKNA